ncbi:MAG: DNA polymerase IV, partial [Oscillospiraceae bacterium]|nr:DNA polymerase IV [Oscillospiraceae bacterium]
SQISIFADEHRRIKREKLELAIDDVRRRFGHYSIARAVTHLDDTLGKVDARGEHVSYPVGFFKEYCR